MKDLLSKPLVRALIAAVTASGLGVAINIATDLKDNLFAWFAVVVFTVVSALTAAATTPAADGRGNIVDRETAVAGQPASTSGRSRWATRRTKNTHGVVMRREIETHPDGTRTERIDYFSVEVALRHLATEGSPGSAIQPSTEGKRPVERPDD